MLTTRHVRPLLALIAAFPLALTLTAHETAAEATPAASICDVVPPISGSPAPAEQIPTALATPSAPTNAADQVDLVLLDLLTAQLEESVATAQIAIDRADHPELQELALQIIGEQTGWLAQLQEWRDAWYPNADPNPLDQATAIVTNLMAGMLDMPTSPLAAPDASAAVIALCTTPGAFDLAYLDLAIPQLSAAIAIANIGLENTTHPELKPFEESLIDTIRKELDQLTAWQSTWS